MGAASFLLPEEALMQRAPGAAVAHVPRVPAAGLAGLPLDDLFAPPNPVPGAEFLTGTGLETLEAPALGYDSKFGTSPYRSSSSHSTVHSPASGHRPRLTLVLSAANLRPPPPPPVSDNPWADFDAGLPVDSHRDAAGKNMHAVTLSLLRWAIAQGRTAVQILSLPSHQHRLQSQASLSRQRSSKGALQMATLYSSSSSGRRTL